MNRHRNVRNFALLFSFSLLLTSLAARGAFTNNYLFGSGDNDGKWPSAGLIDVNGCLYGMTAYGGNNGCGTIFSYNPASGTFSNLFHFGGVNGKFPFGPLLADNGKLYGMASRGGTNNMGVVFEISTNGAGFAVRHAFSQSANDGSIPWGGLTKANGLFYGMTYNGGISNLGVIFSINPTTWAYTNLYRFTGGHSGKHPQGDVIVDGDFMYGMTVQGGSNDAGVVFRMNLNGSNYINLHEFDGEQASNPSGGLLLDGNTLYGLARNGSSKGGIVFSLSAEGGPLQLLRVFSGSATEGGDPYGSLIKVGSEIYGVTRFGGARSQGTIFALGSSFTNLHSFSGGGEPYCTLVASGGKLYGTAFNEGLEMSGSIFSIDPITLDSAVPSAAITWIDGGHYGVTYVADSRDIYVRHTTNASAPDLAFAGYGLSPDDDDETWTWVPMQQRDGLFDGHYEYHCTIPGITATGEYFVAAKFVKGSYVYYPPANADWNTWGDWTTPLNTTNLWIVLPLDSPTNASVSYVSDTSLAVTSENDGIHWIVAFRKEGVLPSFTPPVNETQYSAGTSYPDQGDCVYIGPAGQFIDTNLSVATTYHYMLYTENWRYFSIGTHVFGTTHPQADYDEDGLPDWWEQQYFSNPTGTTADADSDGDGASDWQEFVAGTDPTATESALIAIDNSYTSVGGTSSGPNLIRNPGFSQYGSSHDNNTGTAAYWEWGFPDAYGNRWGNAYRAGWDNHTPDTGSNVCGIISGTWMGATDGGTLQSVAVTPSETYIASGWFKIESSWTGNNSFKLEFLDDQGAVISTTTNNLTTVGTDWTQVSMTNSAPALAARGQIVIESSGFGNDGTFYFDDINLCRLIDTSEDTFSTAWYARTGRVYNVEYKASLTDATPWMPLEGATNLTFATEGYFSVSDPSVSQITNRCYRIRVQLAQP